MSSGWVLTIDACPYAFGTSGVTSGGTPTSSDTDWPVTGMGGTGLLDGYLDEESLRPYWTETVRTTGQQECSAPSGIVIHDAPSGDAPFSGKNVATYLFTRVRRLVAHANLAASIANASTTSVVVDTVAPFAIPGPIWVEREAMKITSAVSTTLTVSRGYYGSLATAHTIDPTHPIEVWADFPWVDRRRCLLWVVTGGVASPVWRGYVRRGARLEKNGAAIGLDVGAAWQGFAAKLPAGDPYAGGQLAGFNQNAYAIGIRHSSGAPSVMRLQRAETSPVFPTEDVVWTQAAHDAKAQVDAAFAGVGAANVAIHAHPDGSGYRVDASIDGIGDYQLIVYRGTAWVASSSVPNGAFPGSDPHTASAFIDGTSEAMVVFNPWAPAATTGTLPANNIPISYATGLPTTWTALAFPDSTSFSTQITPVMRGPLSDDQWLVLVPSATNTPDPYNSTSPYPTLSCSTLTLPRRATGLAPTNLDGRGRRITGVYVPAAIPMRYAARVQCHHWAYGFEHAIGDASVVRSQLDPRDFDFSQIAGIVARSNGPASARDWFLDGSQTWGDILEEACALDGAVLALRSSRIAPVVMGPPVAGSVADFAFATTDLVEGLDPQWEVLGDELVTGADVEAEGVTLHITDARATGRYGTGQTPSLRLDGIEQARTAINNPVAFARNVFGRVAQWGEPLAVVRIPVPASLWREKVFIGHYLDLSEWLAPSGAGTRGVGGAAALAILGQSSQRAQVRGREIADGNVLWLECLLWPFIVGYAPCVRVASISTNVLTIAGPGYANGSDYAGSDDASYRYAGSSPNDGGTAHFKVGDAVELLLRGVNTYTAFTSTISAVNPAAKTITLAGAPGGSWGTWAGSTSTPVDLRYDHYSVCQASQKGYAFVGVNAPPYVIDGTGDKDQTFAA